MERIAQVALLVVDRVKPPPGQNEFVSEPVALSARRVEVMLGDLKLFVECVLAVRGLRSLGACDAQLVSQVVDLAAMAALGLPERPFPLAFALRTAVVLDLQARPLREPPRLASADAGKSPLEAIDPGRERLAFRLEFAACGIELIAEAIDFGHALEELGFEHLERRREPAVFLPARFEIVLDAFRRLEAVAQRRDLILKPLGVGSCARSPRLSRSSHGSLRRSDRRRFTRGARAATAWQLLGKELMFAVIASDHPAEIRRTDVELTPAVGTDRWEVLGYGHR